MATWHKGDVEANGIRLHYTRSGGPDTNKPALLLVHGFSDDGLCWTPLARVLEHDYDCIMVDMRGHGRSEAPQYGYGPAEHAADLRDLIGALGLSRPAILGHSMGAIAALALAGSYPDMPGALMLEDPPDRWMATSETGSGDAARQARTRGWLSKVKSLTREQAIAAERAANPGWSDDELGSWADAKQRLSLAVLNRSHDQPLDWQTTVRRISCPALLITGDTERGAIVSQHAAAALRALVPQLRIAQIDNTGHSIRRDNFERYVAIVRGFLADLGK